MNYKFFWCILITVTLSGCVSSGKKTAQAVQPTGTGTLVIRPIGFKKDAYIREAVKQECNLEGKLTQYIEENAAGQYAKILTDSKSSTANAQVLSIEIEEVQGGGGGAWSGAKVVRIKGKLTEKGRVLGDFIARRYSGGGMFGAYKGTCAILGRCVRTLGKDVAEWLTHPTPKAVLGDL